MMVERTGERCRCGYDPEDVIELGRCERCGQQCCVQCAFIHPESCLWYCQACASET